MAANAAIYFHEEGYRTDQPKLMGRHAAAKGFLKGFLAYAEVDELVAYAESEAQFEAFGKLCTTTGGRNAGLPKHWAGPGREAALARAGTLMLPGPSLAEYGWRRRRHDPRGHAICGVTHTTASQRVMDSFGELLTGPVEPWDAVICTSHAVLATIEHILATYGAWLAERMGAVRFPRPLMPVIPLGIDCDALDPPAAERQAMRRRWREKLGIGEGDVVALFLGRLSWHAKAHPYPMYVGLERAARRHGLDGRGRNGRVHLIEAGWHANDWIRDGFLEGQKALAPSVRCHTVDGRDPAVRREIWQVADLFCSLSDNIQETFGLTPVEAMAAGLPVVASDWNGYRDTLVHGETALLVPDGAAGALGRAGFRRAPRGRARQLRPLLRPDLARDRGRGGGRGRGHRGAGGRRRAAPLDGRGRPPPGKAAVRLAGGGPALPGAVGRAGGDARRGPAAAGSGAGPSLCATTLSLCSATIRPASSRRATRLRAAAEPPGEAKRLAALRMTRLDGRSPSPSPLTWKLLERLQAAGRRGLTQAELLGLLPEAERGTGALAVGWLLKLGLIE